jgi:hypothetical protein
MEKPPVQEPVLTIDLKVQFRKRIYQVDLSQVARVVVPLVILVAKLISYFRENAR